MDRRRGFRRQVETKGERESTKEQRNGRSGELQGEVVGFWEIGGERRIAIGLLLFPRASNQGDREGKRYEDKA